ncbi:hypothetical protein LguiA_021349 [Lonicera macranthoides]
MKASRILALGLGLIMLMNLTGHCYGNELQVGFYTGKCKLADVESMVRLVVTSYFSNDSSIAPALIRMQFHDCFVNGCDASILLDGSSSEKTAPPNLSLRGYEVIDAAKASVEAVCPGVVSCADIIIMATRDVIFLSGGGLYSVETGRRDGLVSLATNVNLPSPSISVSDSLNAFANKSLTPTDMVYLLGGHTIGIAHCSLFQDRLYNFHGTGQADPAMDPALLNSLKTKCPQNSTSDNTANLDQDPLFSSTVDNSYHKQILKNRGILQIDQTLALDQSTEPIVTDIANRLDFNIKFGQAMVKLGAVQVLTGS